MHTTHSKERPVYMWAPGALETSARKNSTALLCLIKRARPAAESSTRSGSRKGWPMDLGTNINRNYGGGQNGYLWLIALNESFGAVAEKRSRLVSLDLCGLCQCSGLEVLLESIIDELVSTSEHVHAFLGEVRTKGPRSILDAIVYIDVGKAMLLGEGLDLRVDLD